MKYGALVLAAIVGLGLHGAEAGSARNGYNVQKVVYYVNDIAAAAEALADIESHLDALGDENASFIVVTHRSGIYMLAEGAMNRKQKKAAGGANFTEAVNALANRGVKFQIDATILRAIPVDKNKISLHAEVVPSALAQVIHLQQNGYLYIKP